MVELELSIMFTNEDAVEALRQALQEFEKLYRIWVRLRVLAWEAAWSELVRVALYRSGPDLSEVGTTWIDSFVSMNALRQFEPRELSTLGGAAAFLLPSWRSGAMLGQTQVWAVPWLTDTRVIYYRRDLLQNSGIDEQTAFASLDRLAQTLQRLQESGVAMPLAIPTAHKQTTLHLLAPWVWQAGGHFTSADGRRVQFSEPSARKGIKAYFDLRRFLTPPARNLTDSQTGDLFRQGKAAVIISGHWLLKTVQQLGATDEVMSNLGVTMIPEAPYVGGSNLVVWKHSRQAEAAITLARYLTGQQVQKVITDNGLLPARLAVLNDPPFTTDPHYQVIGESLKKGRGFQATYMWGLIEDKLTSMLVKLWAMLLADPALSTDEAIAQYLDPLARELNQSLASYG